LFLNLSQLNDLINIQSDFFFENLNPFDPKQLVQSVIADTNILFTDISPSFQSDETVPNTLLGDEVRLRYILSCLINTARKRNKTSPLKVNIYLSDEDKIQLTDESYEVCPLN
jgi:hypothetical protein